MMKEVVRALETGHLAEIGIVAFTVAFVLIVLYTFTLSRGTREHAKRLPLEDEGSPHLPLNGSS